MLIKTATSYLFMKTQWLTLLFILPVLLLQSVAMAKEGDRFEDWTVGCDKLNEKADSPERCFIYQTVVNNETDQPVLQIAVGYLPGDSTPAAILTVPLGVAIKPGMGISVDEGDMIQMAYDRCVPKGCIAGIPLDQNLIKRFEKGLKAQVFLHDGVRQLTLPISLKGFTKGFASLR